MVAFERIPGMYPGTPKRNVLVGLLYLLLLLVSVSTLLEIVIAVIP